MLLLFSSPEYDVTTGFMAGNVVGIVIAWVNLTVLDVSTASAGDYYCTLTTAGCDPLRQGATLRVTGKYTCK